MVTIEVYRSDDWVRIFVDGERVVDDHTVSLNDVWRLLKACGVESSTSTTWVDEEDDFEEEARWSGRFLTIDGDL